MASGSQANNAAEIDRLALALAKDPGSKAFIPLAEEYGKAGMWAEAAGILEDGLKHYPGFITAMVALGRAYDQLHQPTKAKAILEEAVKISPENLRAHRTLAKIYALEGSNESALRSCDVILAINPFDQESLSLRASLGISHPSAAARPGKAGAKAAPSQAKTQTAAPPTPTDTTAETESSDRPARVETVEPVVQASAPESALDVTGISTTLPVEESATHQEALAVGPHTPPEPLAVTSTETVPSRHQAAIVKLEQWLRSIHTRRRDRPSAEPTARTSHG